MSQSVILFLVLSHLSVVVQPHTFNTVMATHTSGQLKILRWPPEAGDSFNHHGTSAGATDQRYPTDARPHHLPMALRLNYNVDKHGLRPLYSGANLRTGDGWKDIDSGQQQITDILRQRVLPWCLQCRSPLPPGRSPEGTSAA